MKNIRLGGEALVRRKLLPAKNCTNSNFSSETFYSQNCVPMNRLFTVGRWQILEYVDIKVQLQAFWLAELHIHMTTDTGKNVIMAGWRATSILYAIRLGNISLS